MYLHVVLFCPTRLCAAEIRNLGMHAARQHIPQGIFYGWRSASRRLRPSMEEQTGARRPAHAALASAWRVCWHASEALIRPARACLTDGGTTPAQPTPFAAQDAAGHRVRHEWGAIQASAAAAFPITGRDASREAMRARAATTNSLTYQPPQPPLCRTHPAPTRRLRVERGAALS